MFCAKHGLPDAIVEPLAAHILENLEAALADSGSDWAPTPVRDPSALAQGLNPRAQDEGLDSIQGLAYLKHDLWSHIDRRAASAPNIGLTWPMPV